LDERKKRENGGGFADVVDDGEADAGVMAEGFFDATYDVLVESGTPDFVLIDFDDNGTDSASPSSTTSVAYPPPFSLFFLSSNS